MDEAEADVLAFMSFPKDHRPKIHSLNPLERLNGEIKGRTDVVGIFANKDAISGDRPVWVAADGNTSLPALSRLY